jgi:hypothetical protein
MAELDDADKFSKNQAGYNALTPLLLGELVTAAALLTWVKDRLQKTDSGSGRGIYPFVQIANGDGTANSDFNPGASANFQVIGSNIGPSAGMSLATLTDAQVLSDSGAVVTANLTHGSLVRMPPLAPGYQFRYLYGYVQPNGGNANKGAIVFGMIDRDARPQTFVQPGNGINTPGPTGHTL